MTAEDRSLHLDNVAIRLADVELLRITATIQPGEVLTVMGPSGSGKSSLLDFVAGFLDPAFSASGHVAVGGKRIDALPPEKRHVGLLFQDPLLFPHMRVGENLLFAMRAGNHAVSRSQREVLVRQALADAAMEGSFDRDPETLSGGQKARVALLRVLLSQPSALLLDEPFSRLDADLRSQMREFVFAQARRRELPVLLVTHDEADAQAAGGRVIRLGAVTR
ncbi:MAG: ATP-binding cassette domain-containing protein [Rhizobiaceae bacterium]